MAQESPQKIWLDVDLGQLAELIEGFYATSSSSPCFPETSVDADLNT